MLGLEGKQSFVCYPAKAHYFQSGSTVLLHLRSMKGLTRTLNVPLGSPTAYAETDLAAFIEDVRVMKASVQA